jgi:hypothetical protein
VKSHLLARIALTALVSVGCSVAGPITAGNHPNWDSQYSRNETFSLMADLTRQFPQYEIVWQDPLVGLLSQANPAFWIVWSSLVPSGPNPFLLDQDAPCANGRCQISAGAAVPVDPIPEPAPGLLLSAGVGALVAVRRKFRKAA